MTTALNSRGIANNNPGNVMANQPWEGMKGQDSVGFAIFSSPPWGFRAMFRNYISYFDAGYNTIRKIVLRWSPPEGNKTPSDPDGTKQANAYIAALCAATGWDPDEVIKIKTWDVASRLCYAQVIHEIGQFAPFTLQQMKEGAFRAGIVDAPPPLIKKIPAAVAGYGAAGTGAIAAATTQVQQIQSHPHGGLVTAILVVASIVLSGLAAYLANRGTSPNPTPSVTP